MSFIVTLAGVGGKLNVCRDGDGDGSIVGSMALTQDQLIDEVGRSLE